MDESVKPTSRTPVSWLNRVTRERLESTCYGHWRAGPRMAVRPRKQWDRLLDPDGGRTPATDNPGL